MQTFRRCSEWILKRLVCDALWQPLNYSALTWRTIHSTGRHRTSQSYTSADLIVMFHVGILCERKHPNVFTSRRQNKLIDCLKIFHPWPTKSASMVRVVSPEECNLFESSMLSSPSILVSLSMLQRSCNLTQTLFIWWLWTFTKSRCHNWTKKLSQMRCNGGYIIFK